MAKIRIMALRHSAFYAPFLMTMSGSYLKDEGLEFEYSPQTADNLVADAFAEGRCDLAQSAVAVNFASLEAGADSDIVHFAQINRMDGFFITAREPDEQFTWDKLIGKDVLVDHLFQPIAMLKYSLHKHGVSYDDLNVIDAGDVKQMDDTFRQGQGDYVHQQGPAPQQLEHDGQGFVVASVGEAVGPVAFSSICSTREWLKTDEAKAYMRAYRKARMFVIESSAVDVAKAIHHYLPDIDINVLSDTIAIYQQMGTWEPEVRIPRAYYEKLLDVFMHAGNITQRYAYETSVVSPPDE